jgi:LacI family transcriptional regulator
MLNDEEHETDSTFPEQRPLTSADVARRAGVSRTTVSYVLNGITNQRISEKTRQRVLAAARELNYQLQPAARALRRGRSDDIYVLLYRPLTLFVSALIQAMQQRAQELGYTLAVYFTDDSPEEDRRSFFLHLLAQRPAAILSFPGHIAQEEAELARSKGTAIYGIASNTPPAMGLQGYEAGSLVAQHLVERGHQRIGLIAPQNKYQDFMVALRLSGMRSVLSQAGRGDPLLYPMQAATLQEARRVAHVLCHESTSPTALYGFNDEYCLHLLRALYEQNIRVPDDIAVVGTDDLFFCELSRPSLTSVRFNIAHLGKRAVDTIDQHVQPGKHEMTEEPPPPPMLIPRESS